MTSDRVTARGGTASGGRVEGHRYARPTAPRLYLIFKPLLRQRLRWDDPPVNSGPLAQGLVRYGLAYLDWITAGFRRSHGVSLAGAGCSPGESVAAEVQRRERQAAHLHRMLVVSMVVVAMAGMLYAGRLEAGRYQWGTDYNLSVIAAVMMAGGSCSAARSL